MRTTPLLLAALCLAAPASAATLPDAIARWTGVTTDVEGRGERVRIVLPPQSEVRTVTARARATTLQGEPGWQLTDIAMATPTRLSGGGNATIRSQHASGWLGEHTASSAATYGGITIDNRGTVTRLDRADVTVTAANGPVHLDLDLAGLHTTPATPMAPRHLALRGHTTEAGITALTAMFNGQPAGQAPLTVDTLSFDVGPASFAGTGTVTFITPTNRSGHITLEATGFNDLMQAVPLDSQLVRLYPVLMVLRQMAHKQNDRLVWTATFTGDHIMMNGLDIAPLLGV